MKCRNTKVKGLKLTWMTLSSAKKQEAAGPAECKVRGEGGRLSQFVS